MSVSKSLTFPLNPKKQKRSELRENVSHDSKWSDTEEQICRESSGSEDDNHCSDAENKPPNLLKEKRETGLDSKSEEAKIREVLTQQRKTSWSSQSLQKRRKGAKLQHDFISKHGTVFFLWGIYSVYIKHFSVMKQNNHIITKCKHWSLQETQIINARLHIFLFLRQ